jgi:hypothetical protein
MFSQMPLHLREQLGSQISYWLKVTSITGDCWTTCIGLYIKMEAITTYFPASSSSTNFKGEIMVGLNRAVEALDTEDPTWLINGKRGVIQFIQFPQ